MPESPPMLTNSGEELNALLTEAAQREKAARQRALLYTLIPVVIGVIFLTVSLMKVSRLEQRANELDSQIVAKTGQLIELEGRVKEREAALTEVRQPLIDIEQGVGNPKEKARQALRIVAAKGQPTVIIPPARPPATPTPTQPPPPPPTPRRTEPVDYTKVFTTREVDQKARLLVQPRAQYTEEARKNGINGTVRVRVVLAASGEVTNITVLSGPEYGLREKAIQAARQIKFQPAIKDGRPVSQYATVDYNFNLY